MSSSGNFRPKTVTYLLEEAVVRIRDNAHKAFSTVFSKQSGKGNGTPLHYSCLENSMDRYKPGGLQSMGLQRVRHN